MTLNTTAARTYLDFERPIAALDSKIEELLNQPEGAEASEFRVGPYFALYAARGGP